MSDELVITRKDVRRLQRAQVAIDMLPPWHKLPGGSSYWGGVKMKLIDVAENSKIVDFDLAVEAVPPPVVVAPVRRDIKIGIGYRRAVAKDKYRHDVDVVNLFGEGKPEWRRRQPQLYGHRFDTEKYAYRVPLDQIPTEADALERISVRVKRSVNGPEYLRTLLAVLPHGPRRYVAWDSCEERASNYRFARKLRVGERLNGE